MRTFLALLVLFGGCAVEGERPEEPAASRARTTTPRASTATLGFRVLDGAGTTLTLAPRETQRMGAAEATFGAAWATAEVTGGRLELTVAVPPAGHFHAAAEGVEVAVYAPVLHEDVDGDGVPGGGERVVGAGRWWPVYARSTGGDVGALGLVEGWNVVRWGNLRDGARGDPAAVPVARNLGPVEELDLAGYALLTDGGDYGMVVWPATGDGDPLAVLDDERLAYSWATHLDHVPPEDHFGLVDGVGLVGAEERVYAYLDRDHDDRFGGSDSLVYEACYGVASVRVAWFDVPTDAAAAVSLARRGLPGGWSAWVDGERGRHPLGADARDMVGIIPSCPVE